jgi:hypothetical protein
MKSQFFHFLGLGAIAVSTAMASLPERPAGNPWYFGLKYGVPSGATLHVGRIIPQQKNHCENGDFGNLCFGPASELELGANSARIGLGWAFVGKYGRLAGLGLFASGIHQDSWLKDMDLGLGTPKRQALGFECSLSFMGINTRLGPYWAIDQDHRGDFVGRATIGYGF